MTTAAIIVAGGKGLRAGGSLPKQLQILSGKPVYQWSIDAFNRHPAVDTTVLVIPIGDEPQFEQVATERVKVVSGGQTRTASVMAGLKAVDLSENDIVLIHDAARPGLSQDIITALLDAINDADAAAPALSVADALKRKSHETLETVPRDDLVRVQTPQVFRYGMIKKALATEASLVDDLAAIEELNGTVSLVAGSEYLAKITYPDDLEHMQNLLSPSTPTPRLGTGFDVHGFEDGDGVTLCGVKIAHDQKLKGHSDADVAWHALTDAILGAAALGDIGDHFPPSDPQWRGVDSAVFLKHAVDLANRAGWALSSCDLTIICEAPKVKPHRAAMRQRTADITGLALDAISVKATTTEGLGFTGRREGIAAQASAVLSPLLT